MTPVCEYVRCEKTPRLTLWTESGFHPGDRYSMDLCAEHYDCMVEYYRGLGQWTDAR